MTVVYEIIFFGQQSHFLYSANWDYKSYYFFLDEYQAYMTY